MPEYSCLNTAEQFKTNSFSAAISEHAHSDIRVHSDQNLHWAHFLDNQRWNVSSSAQRRLCVDAQADLSLHWTHMSECTFSHVASLILWLICNRHETMAISMSYYPQLSVNRLRDLYIPRKKWLNGLQTVETLTRRRVLRRLTWVCTVCQLPSLRVSRLQWVKWQQKVLSGRELGFRCPRMPHGHIYGRHGLLLSFKVD